MIQAFFPEGLDPRQLGRLIHTPLTSDSPLMLRKNLVDKDIPAIKMIDFIHQFLSDIHVSKTIKLTSKGNLNRKFIHQLYEHRIIPYTIIDEGKLKLKKEADYFPIHFAHIITKMAGLAQVQDNALSLTKKGEQNIKNKASLYQILLVTFTHKYDWAYQSYAPKDVGQMGWAYVIYLLLQYGNIERNSNFYATKYLNIFPSILHPFEKIIPDNPIDLYQSCFQDRFFKAFGSHFGLVTLRSEPSTKVSPIGNRYLVKKSSLMDKVFAVRPGVREN